MLISAGVRKAFSEKPAQVKSKAFGVLCSNLYRKIEEKEKPSVSGGVAVYHKLEAASRI